MPITELYVEGGVDSMLANAIRIHDGYGFAIDARGTKDGLYPQVIAKRAELTVQSVFFLRDRDFDYDVRPEVVVPTSISHEGNVIGWYWCRHEAENYLLEPMIISQALSRAGRTVGIETVEHAIRQAALSIRYYQAARWTMGISKRRSVLPPTHDLKTRPIKKEFRLPTDVSRGWCEDWVVTKTQDFLQRVEGTLNREQITSQFLQFERQFSEEQCQDIKWILHMFSGKDLFVALKPWFVSLGVTSSSENTIYGLAEWVQNNPEITVDAIEEWRALLGEFRKFA